MVSATFAVYPLGMVLIPAGEFQMGDPFTSRATRMNDRAMPSMLMRSTWTARGHQPAVRGGTEVGRWVWVDSSR